MLNSVGMNIVYITGYLCKENHPLQNELITQLAENGAKVTVVTGFPSRKISPEKRAYYISHSVEKISDNLTVMRFGSKSGEGGGLFVRMLKYLRLSYTLYRQAKKIKTDAYLIYSSPPFLGWVGILLSKIAPVIYNAQDLFPDTLIRIKKLGEKNPAIRFFRYMEKRVYNAASAVITISADMKKTIVENGGSPDKVFSVYNWTDTKTVCPVPRSQNRLMDELNIDKSPFIISYAGDIGYFQGWPMILQAIKMVENMPIHFVLIGDGSYKKQLLEYVAKNKMKNVSVFPLQPISRVSEIYGIGDIEMVSIESGVSRMSLPSKTWVIMSAGSPVLSIVDQNSEIAEIIKKNNLGYTVAHGSAKELAEVFLKAYAERDTLKQMGQNARKFSEINVDKVLQTKKYFEIIKNCIEK